MEEGDSLPTAGSIWLGGVLWGKSNSCPSPVGWVSWYLFPWIRSAGMYRLGKAWDQGHWWQPLQREVPKDPPNGGCVHTHVKEMLEAGAIHPTQSPWCNAVVLMCKEDGRLCFCIDFCKLNAKTKRDSYLLPHIQEAIESLVGAGYFSCLDLKAGFWQIAMDEVSKQYTAFTMRNLGYFKCECMPFGLCNAPAMSQRLMQNCLGKQNLTYYLIYLDDMIVFSKMEEEHLQCLHTVFNCFREHNLRLNPTKCEFFWGEINYFAWHISKEGVWPSKENLKAVAEFTPPQSYTEISVFRLSGTLPMVHQRICEDSTNIAWTSFWERVPARSVSE